MLLDLRGIPYEEVHHPEVHALEEVARLEQESGHRVARVVVVMADGRPVELVLPASRQVNLGLVRGVLGAEEARLASEEEMARFFPECEVGAVAPLRHWEAQMLMDRSLYGDGEIVIQAGTLTDAIRLNFRDWYDMVRPRIAVFSEPLEPAAV